MNHNYGFGRFKFTSTHRGACHSPPPHPPSPSLHTVSIFSPPSSSQSQDARLVLLNHKHGFWSSSGQKFKLMIVAKLPVYSEKSTCQNKYKSQSEGTTKAQKPPWLLGSWSISFFGMHRWKNSWGWHNKYNKYRFQNNIYCCRKLLSALLFSVNVTVRLCGPKGLAAKKAAG